MRRLRWTTFVLVVLAYALSFFHRMAPATIAADLQQTFAASAAMLGGISATYFYIYMLMQIPTGVLADTLGPRRILTLGGIIAGAGSLMFGLAESVAMLATGRLLVGLGVSVTFIAMLKLHAAWFHDRHFGTFTGLSILLGNLGAVLAAAPLAWVLTSTSWRSVFEFIGVLSLVLGVLSWYLVRNTPTDAGLPSMRELDGHEAHPAHHGHWRDGLLQIVRNSATWPAFWVNFGLSGSYFAFAGLWAVPYLTATYALTRSEATAHTTLLLAGFALGALVIGTLSDRLGRRRPVILGFALLHLACWLPLLTGLQLSQGIAPRLLAVLERVAGPDDVRRAVHTLRDASFDNISLDLIYGIPGQEPSDLDTDLAEALALAPEHLSLYELEAKPGTRFTHTWGDELVHQAEAMEGYFERVVETLTGADYRWYETANFCLSGDRAGGRDLRAHHNLGYWQGRDYLGVGIGAVSTLGEQRRRNGASIGRYIAALGAAVGGGDPPRELEQLDPLTKAQERLMLGLRLDEPIALAGLEHAIDQQGVERMVAAGLAVVSADPGAGGERSLSLTNRGRFLGGGVTAELIA